MHRATGVGAGHHEHSTAYRIRYAIHAKQANAATDATGILPDLRA